MNGTLDYESTRGHERKPWEEFTEEDMVEAIKTHLMGYSHEEKGIKCLRTFPEEIRNRVTKEMMHEAFEGMAEFEREYREKHGVSAAEDFDLEHSSCPDD